MLFSTKEFLFKNSFSSLWVALGRDLIYHSTHPELWPSFSLHLQCSFCKILYCVAGCCSGGLRNPLSELVLHRRKDSFYREIILEGSWADIRSLDVGQYISITYNIILVWNFLFLEGSFSSVSCGSFWEFSCDWRVDPSVGEDLWSDIHNIYII